MNHQIPFNNAVHQGTLPMLAPWCAATVPRRPARVLGAERWTGRNGWVFNGVSMDFYGIFKENGDFKSNRNPIEIWLSRKNGDFYGISMGFSEFMGQSNINWDFNVISMGFQVWSANRKFILGHLVVCVLGFIHRMAFPLLRARVSTTLVWDHCRYGSASRKRTELFGWGPCNLKALWKTCTCQAHAIERLVR